VNLVEKRPVTQSTLGFAKTTTSSVWRLAQNEANQSQDEAERFSGAVPLQAIYPELGRLADKNASRWGISSETNPILSPFCRHFLGLAVACHGL
jgi:hypothetical protein